MLYIAERVFSTAKTPESEQKCSSSCKQRPNFDSSGSTADRILQLQRTAGNQAVQKLIKSGVLQAKLKIGQPNDIYEQEADQVAEKVMSMPEPMVKRQEKEEEEEEEPIQAKPIAEQITPLVQRQVEEEEESVQTKLLAPEVMPQLQRQPEEEEKEKEELLQTKEISGQNAETTTALESRIYAIRGGGRPLGESTRSFFEPRFGYHFSGVRVHTNAETADMARVLNAKAFTVGNNIVFGDGQYAPETSEGRKTLAHELTHVVQQTGESNQGQLIYTPAQVPVQSVNSDMIQLNPLSDIERDAHCQNIVAEMGNAISDFDDGAELAERDMAAAAREREEAAKAIFSVGMAVIVPGISSSLVGVADYFRVSISRDSANIIGSAIGEAAKTAGNNAIDRAFDQNPRQFFEAIKIGFEEAARAKREWIIDNKYNRNELPDSVLEDLHYYWRTLARENEAEKWAEWFRVQWTRYEQQVLPIGTRHIEERSTIELRRARTGIVWVRIGREYLLVLATEVELSGRLRFERWIDMDLEEFALIRACQEQGPIPTVPVSSVIGLPPSVPSSATRHDAPPPCPSGLGAAGGFRGWMR